MKLRFFSIFALAGLLLSSCAVEEVPVTEHTILAVIEGDQTRTTVTDDGTFTWSAGDQVWLHTNSGSVVGTLSSGAGTSSAEFTYGDFVGEMTGNAVYPYNHGHSISEKVLNFVLPSSYDLGTSLDNTNAALFGENVGGTIKFNHLAGVMRFKFKDVPAGVNKFTITLDKKINGTFKADLSADYPVIETSATSTTSEKTVTLNFTALAETSDICVYVPLPIGTYNSLELGLYDDGQAVWTYSKPVTNTVNRKSLKLMPVVTIGGSVGGDIEGDVADLSANGTANSYIVSKSGTYKFSTVKGNSRESVGAVSSAEVLWESFGTDVTPNVGDLVKNISYKNGEVTFQTADTFKEGNAVIAAKDAEGNILWSWHIWLTDQPHGQVYYNNAGTMMDRNLGATSATPGDVGALGLLYQWGRKDPFLGSSSISSNIEAKSTGTWPSAVSSNSINGTIEYATAYPTTFINYHSNNLDWYYTGNSSTDNTRWTTSTATKSIYDPCPSGWRVPDGGKDGIWSKALGSSPSFTDALLYDSTNEGMNFFGKFGSASTIWYPASGYRYNNDGSLNYVGSYGVYWSASPSYDLAYRLYFDNDGNIYPSIGTSRARGLSVRCLQESVDGDIEGDVADLSANGTANSYIVSKSGTYKFSTVKGNSSESVGAVSSAEVLWETFGTDETPNVGDLVKNVKYADGAISFETPSTFKEGNAVIAAKDASDNILWSWHIWLTDQPQGQEYYNNAGTMMDRNLGATSATPGDVGALGLLYQWGRKDPFLSSSSISSDIEAKSTGTWPSAVSSNSTNGTIKYATAYPTTFITSNSSNYDWYYTGSSTTDNTRWTTSTATKSIYDPCPSGWRVPDGGNNRIWSKALGSSSSFTQRYDSTNEGMNFSGKFGSASTIWYPASGSRIDHDGSLRSVGDFSYYWSASPRRKYACGLYFYDDGRVSPSDDNARAYGRSIRCLQESK